MFEPSQRVKVNLSGLTIKGVAFSQNVQEALGTIVKQVSAKPSGISSSYSSASRASGAWRCPRIASSADREGIHSKSVPGGRPHADPPHARSRRADPVGSRGDNR